MDYPGYIPTYKMIDGSVFVRKRGFCYVKMHRDFFCSVCFEACPCGFAAADADPVELSSSRPHSHSHSHFLEDYDELSESFSLDSLHDSLDFEVGSNASSNTDDTDDAADLAQEGVTKTKPTHKKYVVRLACGHEFHPKCMSQWLHDHIACPLCRTSQYQIVRNLPERWFYTMLVVHSVGALHLNVEPGRPF
eukprot:265988-Prorocentrum_minimum.AAC.19